MTPTPQELLATLDAAWRLAPAGTVDIVPREGPEGVVLDYLGSEGRLMQVQVGRWAPVARTTIRETLSWRLLRKLR